MIKNLKSALELPLFGYSVARSTFFTTEYYLLNLLQYALPGSGKYLKKKDLSTLVSIRREILKLLRKDSQNIRDGIYPPSVLWPESPLDHMLRLPKIMSDGFLIYLRRF